LNIDATELEHYRLEQRVKSGANWFYWIAALSVINSLAALSGSTWSFAIGLGFTGVLDALVGSEVLWLRLIGIGLHLWLLAAFIALGYTARRRPGAFTIGWWSTDLTLFSVSRFRSGWPRPFMPSPSSQSGGAGSR
jgi:hypothetical protein